jgi:hypothetical protein
MLDVGDLFKGVDPPPATVAQAVEGQSWGLIWNLF